jgi:hypothetical protein
MDGDGEILAWVLDRSLMACLSEERRDPARGEMLHVFGAGSGAACGTYARGRAWGRVLHACTYGGVNRCRFFLVAGGGGSRGHMCPGGRRGGGGHRKR